MKNFWKKTAAGLLALLIVTGSTPVQPLSQMFDRAAVTASAATVGVSCSVDESSFEVITDVKILGDNSAGDMEDLVDNYKRNGWTVIEQDLNKGAGGWYIYLAYKTATVRQQSDLSNAIRDIIIVKGSDYGKQTTLSGISDTTLSSSTSRTFYKCDSDGDFNSDSNQGDKGNLNRGTGSGTPDLYMYYTRGAGYDNSVMTSLSLSTSSSGSAYCYNNSGATADLNPSGNAAYLRLSRKSVSASYYGFNANTALIYNGSSQPLASPKSVYHGTVYWSVNGGSWTTSQPKATNAGTYTVKSYVKGEFGFGNSPEVSTTVTIARSDANKPTVTIDSTIETGTTYAPALVGMAADYTGAVTYKYSNSQNGVYSSTQPKTAGTYWVKAEIAEDSNYNAYTTAPVSFKILNRSKVTVSEYENGTVTSDKDTALTGETVTLTVSPTYNHFVKSITVNGEALSPDEGVYSFAMPSQDALIAAEFAQSYSDVVWKNWNGDVLETDKAVDYGTMPEYNGETPTKEATAQYTYTFSGWSPAISSVKGDIVYTAQFSQTVNKYTVTWKNGDTVLETDEAVEYGVTPEYNGETPTKPMDDDYIYTFSGWSPAISSVEGDIVYTAQFSQTVNKFAVTWKNGDTVLETDEAVRYGETPEYNGKTPTKPMDDDYIYTFSGWSPAISSVEGDIVYTAQFTATARTDKCGDRAYWSFDESTGKLTISGTGAMYDYKYNTQPWYDYRDKITSVEIEKGITSIGEYAFYFCRSLTSITIPDSVTSIGADAFDNCRSLSSITIPDSVKIIGYYAFYYCTSLKSITIPDSVTSIGKYAFYGCTGLTSIEIPDSVTNIGKDAFYNCTNIKDVYCYTDPEKLTWNEDGRNDFISDGSTVCHVPAEYLSKYQDKFGDSVNVTFKAEAMGKCGDHATWDFDLDTGKLTISGTGAMYDYKYNTQPWYDYRDKITSVEIEKGITSIGEYAFYFCRNLTSITIPDSVTSIGADAFDNCRSLSSITIPDSVKIIGYYAFYYCTSLESIPIPDSVESIDDFAFYYCTSLKSITIPDSVTSIGHCAFYNCTSLSSITIPDSVTSIGKYAFYGCTGLTSIEIPDSVTNIGKDAFYNCTNIKDVYCYTDPEKLTWNEDGRNDFISDGSTVCHVPAEYLSKYQDKFGDSVNVTFKAMNPSGKCGENATWELDLDTGKLTISGTGALYDYSGNNQLWHNYKDNITSVEIENGITSIGNFAFITYSGLTSITIPDSVTSIGNGAFEHCENLTSITIPDSVTSIGSYAFEYCTSLTSITIPDSVTSIGAGAFCDCSNLTSITIPDSVTSMGNDAFYGCTNITDVYCYADPENLTWDENSCDDFIKPKNSKMTVCHVPAEYLSKYQDKFGDSVNVTFKAMNPSGKCGVDATWEFDLDTGKLTISGTGDMADYKLDTETDTVNSPWFAYKDNITSVVIENGITSVGIAAFYNCTSLESITIPDSVTSIGNHAFQGCKGLTSITIPDSVTSIGAQTFDGCTGLTSIKIPDSVTSMGDFVFYNCISLTSVTISDSITSIGNWAFQGCKGLTSITIPDSVTNIGVDAFYKCTDITDVYCYANPANLTWDEEGCDDFIKTPKHTTVCHVPAEYLSKYQDKFGDSVNVTFKGTPTVTAPTANTLTYNGGEQELVTAGSTDFGKVLYSLDGTNYSEDIPKATNADTYTVYYKVDTDNYYYAPQTVEVMIAESYTITWKNGDEILETDNYVNYGTTPEYNGETPSMTGEDNEMYVFSGWSPTTSEVTGNATYTAQFIKYTKVSAVPATYTSAGNSEYYTCSDGKYYVFDGNEFTETAENSWIIPKLEITDEAVISFANISLGGELGLNFYVTVPDDLVSAGAKAVMSGPAGEKETVLSSLTKDSDGCYKLTYKIRAIDSDRSVSLKLIDSSGNTIGLFKTNGEQITDDTFTYSIYEYVNAALQLDEQYVTADQKKKIKAMNTYAAYSVKWKYNTPLPTDGSINELPEVAAETLAKYQLTKSGTANVEITGASLLLDSNTAFKLYFKCDTVPDITLDGKAVVPVRSGDEYFIIVENIGVKDLKTEYTVEFGESYTVKFSALSYAYSVLKNKDSYPELISDELCDLVKAIYAYSESYVPEN